jgi:CHAD domain-containing protein
MHTGSPPPNPQPDAPQPNKPTQPERHPHLEAWRALLDRCARKASPKRVHDLRIATLRLQAALEYRLREQTPDADGVRAVKRWMKHGKRLRRALEPVREADVYLELLGSLRDPAAGPDGRMPHRSSRCLREIEALESRLKRRRATAAEALLKEIQDHRKRLDQCSKEMEKALEPHGTGEPAAQLAWQIFDRLAGEFPDLSGGNLHAYRKQLKTVRYLAETGADVEALQLAKACRKMLNAAGNWHDWLVLAKEARRRLPKRGKEGGLLAVLRTMEEEALRRALGICQRHRARLVAGRSEDGSTAQQ